MERRLAERRRLLRRALEEGLLTTEEHHRCKERLLLHEAALYETIENPFLGSLEEHAPLAPDCRPDCRRRCGVRDLRTGSEGDHCAGTLALLQLLHSLADALEFYVNRMSPPPMHQRRQQRRQPREKKKQESPAHLSDEPAGGARSVAVRAEDRLHHSEGLSDTIIHHSTPGNSTAVNSTARTSTACPGGANAERHLPSNVREGLDLREKEGMHLAHALQEAPQPPLQARVSPVAVEAGSNENPTRFAFDKYGRPRRGGGSGNIEAMDPVQVRSCLLPFPACPASGVLLLCV